MNDSNDFQPPTRNPQSNVGGNLQPNASTALQPIGNNNEPGQLNPQALPETDNLKVVTATNGTQNSPATASPQAQLGPWVWLPALFGVVIAIMIFKRDKKDSTPKRKKPGANKPEIVRTSVVLKDKALSGSKAKAKNKKAKKKTKHKRR